jgi:hypothetical protein
MQEIMLVPVIQFLDCVNISRNEGKRNFGLPSVILCVMRLHTTYCPQEKLLYFKFVNIRIIKKKESDCVPCSKCTIIHLLETS